MVGNSESIIITFKMFGFYISMNFFGENVAPFQMTMLRIYVPFSHGV